MVETSDDRNGVVVNRASRLNKRHSESTGREEVQRVASSEINAKSEAVLYSAS